MGSLAGHCYNYQNSVVEYPTYQWYLPGLLKVVVLNDAKFVYPDKSFSNKARQLNGILDSLWYEFS